MWCILGMMYSCYSRLKPQKVWMVHMLNVYTGQNPRRRVISVKTAKCVQYVHWLAESCLLVYIFTSAFILGWYLFKTMNSPSTGEIQIYRKKPPQRIFRWPLPSKEGTYSIIPIWLDFYVDDMSPWVLSSIPVQQVYTSGQLREYYSGKGSVCSS
jgi:hypothetical protein